MSEPPATRPDSASLRPRSLPYRASGDHPSTRVPEDPPGRPPFTKAKVAELEQTSNIVGKYPLPFSVDEQRKVADLKTSTLDTVLKNVDLFITGRRPMDEWDAFINEVKSAGATDLEVLYNRTYNFKVKR